MQPKYCDDSVRKQYYFSTRKADYYMLGTLLFWITSGGVCWKNSDLKTNKEYYAIAVENGGWNLKALSVSRSWSRSLRIFLRCLLYHDPRYRYCASALRKSDWYREVTS